MKTRYLTFSYFLLLPTLLLLSSCNAYYVTGYETDGIYASRTPRTEVATTTTQSSSFYKQYFQSKDKTYEVLPEEGAIFTDIEAYSTIETIDDDGNIIYEPRYTENDSVYGAWGENTQNVTINYYDQNWGWNNHWGIAWNRWAWNSPFFPQWGFGWNNWGWGWNNWGWGWNNWGWGWNQPFFNTWWCPPYWNNGFYNPYFNAPYRNSYAYNRGRRNTDLMNGRTYATRRGASNINRTSRGLTSRTTTSGRRLQNRQSTMRRSNARVPVNSQRRSINTNTRSRNSQGYRPSSTRSTRNSNMRSNSGSRRSSSFSRPSSSRSSSFRSSGGSSRSSGSRGGGGSRRNN